MKKLATTLAIVIASLSVPVQADTVNIFINGTASQIQGCSKGSRSYEGTSVNCCVNEKSSLRNEPVDPPEFIAETLLSVGVAVLDGFL